MAALVVEVTAGTDKDGTGGEEVVEGLPALAGGLAESAGTRTIDPGRTE